MMYLYVNNYIADAFSIIAFILSTSLIHKVYKKGIKQRQILFLESKLQYDFNDFQCDYKGVPGQALITETWYFFQQR